MTNNLIMRATDLNRHYQQGDVTLSVLSGVNVSIEQGEKIAIVGVSGSGKTTLLNLLGGLDDADTGEVTLAGKSWHDLGASITGFTLYIFTIYSAIYGYLFFNEQLEYYHYIGTILVFGGVYIVKRKV